MDTPTNVKGLSSEGAALLTKAGMAVNTADDKADDDASLLRFLVDMKGEAVSDKQLRDDLMTMLVAGHETTVSTCSVCVLELSIKLRDRTRFCSLHTLLLRLLKSINRSASLKSNLWQ